MKPQQLELGVTKHPAREKFEQFDNENPYAWELFKQFTFEAIRNGHRQFSIALVTERIRWETVMKSSDSDFKINNNHKAFFARKFHEEYPMYNGIFRTRPSVADL